jgi:hypothetical protein
MPLYLYSFPISSTFFFTISFCASFIQQSCHLQSASYLEMLSSENISLKIRFSSMEVKNICFSSQIYCNLYNSHAVNFQDISCMLNDPRASVLLVPFYL